MIINDNKGLHGDHINRLITLTSDHIKQLSLYLQINDW